MGWEASTADAMWLPEVAAAGHRQRSGKMRCRSPNFTIEVLARRRNRIRNRAVDTFVNRSLTCPGHHDIQILR
jgi:hypothetical protein